MHYLSRVRNIRAIELRPERGGAAKNQEAVQHLPFVIVGIAILLALVLPVARGGATRPS